jgi:DNA-binding IscR family transcriptional regulator
LHALDGDILSLQCVSEEAGASCDRATTCAARTVWEAINARVRDALENMTLADL